MTANDSRDQRSSERPHHEPPQFDAESVTANGRTVIYDPDNSRMSVETTIAFDLLEVR